MPDVAGVGTNGGKIYCLWRIDQKTGSVGSQLADRYTRITSFKLHERLLFVHHSLWEIQCRGKIVGGEEQYTKKNTNKPKKPDPQTRPACNKNPSKDPGHHNNQQEIA